MRLQKVAGGIKFCSSARSSRAQLIEEVLVDGRG